MNRKPCAEHNAAFGKKGEDLACDFLKNLGYSIIERNVRVHHKELDIVAFDLNYLVVVEVKTRSQDPMYEGSWALTHKKIANVTSAGYEYARSRSCNMPVRFDSVICQQNYDGSFSITHEKNAFYAPWKKIY